MGFCNVGGDLDIVKERELIKDKQQKAVSQLNQLRQQFQQQEQNLLQEILRLDGEARLLNRLDGNSEAARGVEMRIISQAELNPTDARKP
jgi:hypothetical protein